MRTHTHKKKITIATYAKNDQDISTLKAERRNWPIMDETNGPIKEEGRTTGENEEYGGVRGSSKVPGDAGKERDSWERIGPKDIARLTLMDDSFKDYVIECFIFVLVCHYWK